MIYVIAAVAENDVIGYNGNLPWHISRDMQWFKMHTYGGCVIMGRKTWESIGKRPLPGRTNIVMTRTMFLPCDKGVFIKDGVYFCHSIDTAFDLCQAFDRIYIIGGSEIYNAAFLSGQVRGIILTRIHNTMDGDRYLVLPDKKHLVYQSKTFNAKELSYTFEIYKLKG